MVRNHVGKRALVAIAAGLALAGTPAAFALTAAPTVALAAGTQGRAVTVEHNSNHWLSGWSDDDCLKESLEDQTVGDITLNAEGEWNPASGIMEVTVDRDLTIHGFPQTANQTGHNNNFINDIVFKVTPGHTLTPDNVNNYTDPMGDNHAESDASTFALWESRTVIDVQGGGKLVTKGTGDIVSNNGNGEAIAVKLEDGATAELGAAPSGFQWDNDHAGNYGSTVAVKAGKNTTLTITNGRFTEENGDGAAIYSNGRVVIDPVNGAQFWAPTDELGGNLGTVKVEGDGAVLVAKHTQFGLNEQPSDEHRENKGVDASVVVAGGAKAYLTDSYASSVSPKTDSGVYDIKAISVDKDSVVYSQDNTWNTDLSTYSTDSDQPGFSKLTSAYEGDHLTKNAYYVEGTNESFNNTVEGSTQFFKIADGQSFSDLETQVAAKADGLKTEATANEDEVTAAVKAELPLGKSNVYGKYEIVKNSDTGITGEGHVYEVSAVQNLQAGWDVSAFRRNGVYTAPAAGAENTGVAGEVAPEGTVFAGWYTAGGDLTTGSATNTPASFKSDVAVPEGNAADNELKADATDGYAYAKFIPEAFLKAGAQKEAVKAGDAYNVRFLSAVDSYNYNKVTYTVQAVDENGKNVGEAQAINATTAFDYLGVTENGQLNKVRAWETYKTADALYPYAQSDVHAARYFTRGVLKNVRSDFKGSFKVTVSVVTPDGTVVTAPASEFTVDQLSKSVAE